MDAKAKGTPYDEIDLGKLFEGKPEQLQHVKDHAETFVHPQRGCKMWIVDDISIERSDATETTTTRKRELAQCEANAVPAAKKVKSEPVSKEQPLNEAQRKRLVKIAQALTECDQNFIKMTAQLEGDAFLANFMPDVVKDKLAEAGAGIVGNRALVEEALKEGWVGKFQEVARGATEARTLFDEAHKSCSVFCETADSCRPAS